MSAMVQEATFTGEVHPYADRWPMLSADDTRALADDIAANGLWHPIVLDTAGRLIDGRNRLAACTLAGVAPAFVTDERLGAEDAIAAYIWSANGERRDMTKGQKAMLAALRPGPQVFLGNSSGVSQPSVAKARQVIQWCPTETVDAVIDGSLALNDAYEQAQHIKATEQAEEIARKREAAEAKRKAEELERRLDDLRQARPDLADLVQGGKFTLGDALTLRATELAAEKKAAEQRRGWLRKLRDTYAEALLGVDTITHPNNLSDVVEALATFPVDPMFDAMGPDAIRRRATALADFADRIEAQP